MRKKLKLLWVFICLWVGSTAAMSAVLALFKLIAGLPLMSIQNLDWFFYGIAAFWSVDMIAKVHAEVELNEKIRGVDKKFVDNQ